MNIMLSKIAQGCCKCFFFFCVKFITNLYCSNFMLPSFGIWYLIIYSWVNILYEPFLLQKERWSINWNILQSNDVWCLLIINCSNFVHEYCWYMVEFSFVCILWTRVSNLSTYESWIIILFLSSNLLFSKLIWVLSSRLTNLTWKRNWNPSTLSKLECLPFAVRSRRIWCMWRWL